MTLKDIGVIKRRLKADKPHPGTICGCYLDARGQMLTVFRRQIPEVPTAEMEKYYAIFRKSLSGVQGQQLLPVVFGNEQLQSDDAYASLMKLCRTELEDEETVSALYERVMAWMLKEKSDALQSVDAMKKAANYLVLLLYDTFDVAYRHGDGEDDMSMSENVFNYVLCAVAPVMQGKESLCYVESEAAFHVQNAAWTVGMPEVGFMFPTLENGSANISEALYYTRDADEVHESFLHQVFHTDAFMPAEEQKETVRTILQTALREECSMDVVQAVNEKVSEMITEQKEDKAAEPLQLSGHDVARVLEHAGVSEDKVEAFRQNYTQAFGEKTEIPAVNVVSPKEFKVVTPSVQIRVDPEHADLVTTKVIDGQKYIMILADGEVEVNGINIAIQ